MQANSKKTIIYVGGFELPDKNAAAQRVLSNAKIFRKLGFNVILVGVDKTLSVDVDIEQTELLVEGFKTFSTPYPSDKISWLKQITAIDHIKTLLKYTVKEDIYSIIAYNYPAVALYKLKNICKEKGIYLISDITEWYGNNGGSLLFNMVKWLDTTVRMQLINPKMDGLIVISQYLKSFYNKKNDIVLELPTLFDIGKSDSIESTEASNDIINLMYAGSAFNLERVDKNRTNIKDRLDKIISILDKVHKQKENFVLNIYGLTKENYLSAFPEYASILETLSKQIIFHGRKPHKEIIKAIQKSDFTIFLRNVDRVIEAGFPTKFSESISYGTPVITNAISNITPYSTEKNSILLNLANDDEAITQMINVLNLAVADRVEMKEYCFRHKIFDYRHYIDEVELFLAKLEQRNR